MDLKYCISNIENEKLVLETPGREGGEIERLLGLNWNVVTDTIESIPVYNLFGQSRGRFLGPHLVEMSSQEILSFPISRLTLLRLTVQTY